MSEHIDEAELSEALETVSEPAKEIPAPEPGLYLGVPPETYFGWPLFSHSASKSLERSPAHCRQEQLTPRKTTDALRLGDAIHAAILEPERFMDTYVAQPKFDRRTKQGKADYAQWMLTVPNGAKVIKQDELLTAQAVGTAFYEHAAARNLLKRCTPEHREVSIVWEDEAGGLKVKARIDACLPQKGLLLDLKTTDDAGPIGFPKSVTDYRYYRQLAFYRRALRSQGFEVNVAVIIAIEKERPYGIAAYEFSPEQLDIGDREIVPLMRLYAECAMNDSWPCYSQKVQRLVMPSWFAAKA